VVRPAHRAGWLHLLDANPRVERKVMRALAERVASSSTEPGA
jgi:hypothetical protein